MFLNDMNLKNPFTTTLISGVLGGVALTLWNSKEHGRAETQGIWLLYIFIIAIVLGLFLTKYLSDYLAYWQRVKYGTLTGAITGVIFFISEILFSPFAEHPIVTQLLLFLITVTAAFVISLLAALIIRKPVTR